MTSKPLIQVGVIAGAHGVRGQVKIRSLTEPPKEIFSYGPLTDAKGARRFALTAHGGMDAALIAAIDGVTDRNEAEKLKGTALFIRADDLPQKKEGQYHRHELIDLEAKLADGTAFGKVIAVHNFGAGDILEILPADGKSEMFAFTPANFPHVDVKAGRMTIHPPEEL